MSTPKAKKLGAAIKRYRKARGLSQERLGKAVKLPASTILRLERGEFKAPSPEKLQRIAGALEVEFEELFELAGYATPEPPEVLVYLRRKGLSEDDAVKGARYVEGLMKQQQGGGRAKRGR
jgi:transcriptional regulator with XRE-family HTH domain